MKPPVIALIIYIILISCNNGREYKPHYNVPKTQLEIAQGLVDSLFYYIEQRDKGEISKKTFKSLADPINDSITAIRQRLNDFDKEDLKEYSKGLLEGLAERKATRDKSK